MQVSTTKYHLEDHKKRIHRKVREAQCTLCPKSFCTKKDMNRHIMYVHQRMDYKKFVCTICESRFSRQGALNQHFR